jgi:hypothetical protein
MSDPECTLSRHDGWSPSRQRDFLEHLAVSGLVRTACAAVGISREAAYRLRQRREGAAFALGWDAALLLARWALADTLMERAVDGQTDVVERDPDGQRHTRHRHDNRLALSVLGRLDRFAASDAAGTGDARLVAGDWEAFLDLIGAGREGAGAGLFLTARRPVEGAEATTPGPCQLCGSQPSREDHEDAQGDEDAMPRAVHDGFIDEGDDGCGEELDEPGMRDWLSVYRIDSGWVTNFPPPDGYLGREEGVFGLDPTYRRTLTDAELDAVETRQAARIAREAAIARRLYAEAFPVAESGCGA